MTAKRRLLSKNEILEAGDLALAIIAKASEQGLAIGGVDIRADGVTILPHGEQAKGGAFDAWKTRQQDSQRPARR